MNRLGEGVVNGIQPRFALPGMGELVVVLIIILVLFGASRVPEIAKAFGKGIKEFKKSVKDDESDPKNGS